MGELTEVARLVTFLASDGAGFVNGQAIAATGGLDWAP
jgi:NAD(P)-dependent dehydrogenase (short-subunit alcohol dehydrogenase family)